MKEINIFAPIDEEEKELLRTLQNDEWVEVENQEEYKTVAKEYAKSTIKKDKRMNIRISERDLKNLKIRAMEEGLPYQTLVSMVLHKYVSGRFKENV